MEITFYFSDQEIEILAQKLKSPNATIHRQIHKLGCCPVKKAEDRAGQMNKRIYDIQDAEVIVNLATMAWNEGCTINKLILKKVIYPLLFSSANED